MAAIDESGSLAVSGSSEDDVRLFRNDISEGEGWDSVGACFVGAEAGVELVFVLSQCGIAIGGIARNGDDPGGAGLGEIGRSDPGADGDLTGFLDGVDQL